jgi:hypothetical protein
MTSRANTVVSLRKRALIPFLAAMSALPLLAENPNIPASPTLTIRDTVSADSPKRDFTAASLRELVAKGQLKEVDSGPVIIYGEHTGDQGVWQFKGVRVLDLVKLATGYQESMDNPLYRKHKGLYLAAYASDGYGAVLSWSELLFNPTGSLALVAYDWKLVKAANAGARPPFTGDMVLVVPTDSFSGSREVQALKSIEVRSIGDPAK